MISNYIMVLDTIATGNLDLAKEHQIGRVAEDTTTVAIDFIEIGL